MSYTTGSTPPLISFELPVYVRQPSSALRLLGGDAVAAALVYGAAPHAELRLRPDDPFHHPVRGARSTTNTFVARVRRSGGGGLRVDVVGVATATYRWDATSDFQFLPTGTHLTNSAKLAEHAFARQNDAATGGAGGSAGGAGDSAAPHPLVLTPHSFSHMERPKGTYDFRSSVAAGAGAAGGGALGGAGAAGGGGGDDDVEGGGGAAVRSNGRVARLRYSLLPGMPIPTAPAHVPRIPGWRMLLDRIRRAFAARPVWSLYALCIHLCEPLQRVSTLLPAVAFSVNAGPFRHTWLRLSYDPSQDPSSRILQALDVKLPAPFAHRTPRIAKPQGVKTFAGGADDKSVSSGGGGDAAEAAPAVYACGTMGVPGGADTMTDSSPPWMRFAGTLISQRMIVQLVDLVALEAQQQFLKLQHLPVQQPQAAEVEDNGAGSGAGAGAGVGTGAAAVEAPTAAAQGASFIARVKKLTLLKKGGRPEVGDAAVDGDEEAGGGAGGDGALRAPRGLIAIGGSRASCLLISDEQCRELLSLIPVLDTFHHKRLGWIPDDALDKCRRLVSDLACAHINMFAAAATLPAPNPDSTMIASAKSGKGGAKRGSGGGGGGGARGKGGAKGSSGGGGRRKRRGSDDDSDSELNSVKSTTSEEEEEEGSSHSSSSGGSGGSGSGSGSDSSKSDDDDDEEEGGSDDEAVVKRGALFSQRGGRGRGGARGSKKKRIGLRKKFEKSLAADAAKGGGGGGGRGGGGAGGRGGRGGKRVSFGAIKPQVEEDEELLEDEGEGEEEEEDYGVAAASAQAMLARGKDADVSAHLLAQLGETADL